jgi:hypothetical protein
LHRAHRRRWYCKIQHIVLDHLSRSGSFHVSDLDDLDLPDGIHRSVIGTAINDLSRKYQLTRRAGPPTPSAAGGRHGNWLHHWQLLADHAAVRAWKLSHPVPSDSEQEIDL